MNAQAWGLGRYARCRSSTLRGQSWMAWNEVRAVRAVRAERVVRAVILISVLSPKIRLFHAGIQFNHALWFGKISMDEHCFGTCSTLRPLDVCRNGMPKRCWILFRPQGEVSTVMHGGGASWILDCEDSSGPGQKRCHFKSLQLHSGRQRVRGFRQTQTSLVDVQVFLLEVYINIWSNLLCVRFLWHCQAAVSKIIRGQHGRGSR